MYMMLQKSLHKERTTPLMECVQKGKNYLMLLIIMIFYNQFKHTG